MEAINQLEHSYFLLKSGGGDYRDCIAWALERLRDSDEADDQDIVMLAASSARFEVMTFTAHVIERYSGQQALDAQLAAGKYLVTLRHDYQRHVETLSTLESKLLGLYERLNFPGWLCVLCRNCRYAKQERQYQEFFDKEFAYLARLWAVANSRRQFEARYSAAISAQHDAL